jgi:type VI secretion system FHA domain protein
MVLTLEVIGPLASKLGAGSRRTFSAEGGIIGREKNSDWVLPHTKVSGRHARITCSNGVFYIEDKSTNGTFLNSQKNRLQRDRPYALKSGDRIYIDPYAIDVSVTSEQRDSRARESGDAARSSRDELGASDDFGSGDLLGDPRFPPSTPAIPQSRRERPGEVVPGHELDPLKLLDPDPKPRVERQTPSAADLERGSPMAGHYQPPAVPPTPVPTPRPTPSPNAPHIPEDYDPMSDDPFDLSTPLSPPPVERERVPESVTVAEPPPVIPVAPAPVAPPAMPPPPPLEEIAAAPPRKTPPPPTLGEPRTSDLAAVLAGAGLEDVPVTPEFARNFGAILRVVVSGVMDVLRARQQIKDEFRMRMTQFRVADNNPLKFSANVEDALHNLLVKRNVAYLEPVDAFEDAFDDLRNHQIAMLAGMRVAFESMLTQFDPDRLEKQFERQLKRGALLGVTAKLRYWELYAERQRDMAKDPEVSFRKLFGEEFAKAYEEQLNRLKAESRAKVTPKPPQQPPKDR